jgi:hypothetical protein
MECVFQGYEVLATCCKQGIIVILFDKPRMNISNLANILEGRQMNIWYT